MLSVEGVSVSFGDHLALDDVSFDVGDNEIVVLLGPSGCGKSTLLRAIAGLQPLDSGRVLRHGEDLASSAPHERGIGMMFQDHALFPHRDVGQNVEFGLRMAGVASALRSTRVAEILELVGLSGFERRAVGNLSGGEAQRVALARALAPEPRVLLLDEPLGSLDRELRDRLVEELPGLLREVGISAIHVTHDHDEAFAVAEKLLVMGEGRIVRSGSPTDVWSDPRHEAAARFLGHRNIVEIGPRGEVPWGILLSDPGRVVILPDAATVLSDTNDPAVRSGRAVEVRVIGSRFRGASWEVDVETEPGGARLHFVVPAELSTGQRVYLVIDPSRVRAVS